MPSLEQYRYEALAAHVERARGGAFAASILGVEPEPLPARVKRRAGSIVELQLEEVVLDGSLLRGRDAKKHPVVIPLDDVKSVWLRRLHPRRAAAVYIAVVGASALLPMFLASPEVPLFTAPAMGLLLGLPLCGGAWIVLKRLRAFQEWRLVYDRDVPSDLI